MKTSFQRKLFFSFFIIFLLFTAGIILFEQSREREYKTEALEEKLDTYADMIDATVQRNGLLDSLIALFPANIRVSLIDRQGIVTYDNVIRDVSTMENHGNRPEIKTAWEKQTSSVIRTSATNEHAYLYYAKRFHSYFVRVALPYDIQVKNFLKADNLFLYYILALFVLTLFILNYASNRFGQSIRRLKDFTDSVEKENNSQFAILNSQFPNDELGEIGARIARNYQRLKASEKEVLCEKEKLLQHVHSSEEGVCFFSANRQVEFYNGLFIQYLNTIMEEAESNPVLLFQDVSFVPINDFLSNRQADTSYFETKITKHGKTFIVRLNVFDNQDFELIINDITEAEKTRQLKQEMTGNITHELKTPVTGIRACLETVLEQNLEAEKERHFIRQAYEKILSLSELIQDLGLITKMEEAPQAFLLKPVNLSEVLEKLENDLSIPLKEKNIQFEWEIGQTTLLGNSNLFYSIFRNLTDNAIRYAGENISIKIKKYNEDAHFCYFSYSDNGVGVSNEHLNRLFERFYRADEGRTRDMGGSGLGLSIVKNAVLFHKGNIVAKNKAGGGLEFLFQLPVNP